MPANFIRSNFAPNVNELNPDFVSRTNQFARKLRALFQKRKTVSNLMTFQASTLDRLKANDDVVIFKTDKNLGPAILEKDVYIQRALTDHLLDDKTYVNISEHHAFNRISNLRANIKSFIQQSQLDKADRQYLTRYAAKVSKSDGFAYFYLLAKVHKTPWATRPIVSASGSVIYGLSKWVDTQLQKIIKLLPYTIKCSSDLVKILTNFKDLPSDFRFFSADASSMYTNIDTTHALAMIEQFFASQKDLINQAGVNAVAVLRGLRLVMCNNIFKFGNTFWWQLSGTAMGTPCAPAYATLYYAIHEMSFVPRYKQVYYYVRYLDDILCIWKDNPTLTAANLAITTENEDAWVQFQSDTNNYGTLKWVFTERSDTIEFLDLCIYKHEHIIHTKLYEKALNLYLYLPAHSAHTPGTLKGLIIGMLLRIHRLTSDKTCISADVQRFYERLVARGYQERSVRDLFNDTIARIAAKQSSTENFQSSTNFNFSQKIQPEQNLMLHLRYHPYDPPSTLIQKLFRETMLHPNHQEPLEDLKTRKGVRCDFQKLTIAYSRHLNVGNILSVRKLNNENVSVSSVMDDLMKNKAK